MPKKPPKTEDWVQEAGKSKPIYETKAFWKRTLEKILANKEYKAWQAAGAATERLAVRRVKGTDKEKNDLINAVAALARAQVGDVLYNDPIPTVRAKQNRERLKEMEPGWKKMLGSIASHNEYTHQVIGGHFVLWGVGVLKVLPSVSGISFQHVRPDNFVFDERWIGNGGEPQDKAFILGEKISKLLSELLADKEYDADAVEEIKLQKQQKGVEPPETIEVDIWEFNIKIGNEWHIATYCALAERLLQFDSQPINEPTYSWILTPGPIGLNNGVMAENIDLDSKMNTVMKRGLTIAAKRGYLGVYDKNKVDKDILEKMQQGVATVGVDVPEGGDLKKCINMEKFGDFDAADAGAIATMRDFMQWQASSTPEKLSQGGGKPVTATETQFVAHQQQKQAAPWARLVDRYLDRSMQLAALWLKYLWDMEYYDWFTSILNEEEMQLFSQWMPHLSNDLQEFEFGVESGSTQKFRNAETLNQINQYMEKLPMFQQMLAQVGKKIDVESIILRYTRAMDALGSPEELIQDMTQEEIQFMQQQQMAAQGMEQPEMGGEGMQEEGFEGGGQEMGEEEIMAAMGAMQ